MTQDRSETLGSAERIIQTLLTMTDHIVHGRPGIVMPARNPIGASWTPCRWKETPEGKQVLVNTSTGKKASERVVGMLSDDGKVTSNGQAVGEYRKPSDRKKLFPEAVAYIYQQVADIWKMDNELAARWASYAFNQENRDIKTVLAAFMLVQDRYGEAVIENGELLFFDDDYRAVGVAMFLIRGRGSRQLDPKLIGRVGDILQLPEVEAINRELGFGRSQRKPPMGRYSDAVTKWLEYREQNPRMLKGLVDSGQGDIVRNLARRVHYKPQSPEFFRILGWKQKGNIHRTLSIGEVMEKVSFAGMSEKEICEKIAKDGIGYKRVVGMLPESQEVTQAIMAATIESGGVSEKDLIILTPTLEALGLLTIDPYKTKWQEAVANAKDQRAANVAKNVKSKEAVKGLESAADNAATSALEEVTRDLRVYCMVDKSASMNQSLSNAKSYLAKFLGGFPLDRLHVSVFNSVGTEINIRSAQRAAVEQAFRGHSAGGSTSYRAGIHAVAHNRPKDNEDVLMIFVGDQAGEAGHYVAKNIRDWGMRPMAFGLLYVPGQRGSTVDDAAAELNIPCFRLSEEMFSDDDPYAVTRIVRDLIAATPAGQSQTKRVSLIDQILKTELLQVPEWA